MTTGKVLFSRLHSTFPQSIVIGDYTIGFLLMVTRGHRVAALLLIVFLAIQLICLRLGLTQNKESDLIAFLAIKDSEPLLGVNDWGSIEAHVMDVTDVSLRRDYYRLPLASYELPIAVRMLIALHIRLTDSGNQESDFDAEEMLKNFVENFYKNIASIDNKGLPVSGLSKRAFELLNGTACHYSESTAALLEYSGVEKDKLKAYSMYIRGYAVIIKYLAEHEKSAYSTYFKNHLEESSYWFKETMAYIDITKKNVTWDMICNDVVRDFAYEQSIRDSVRDIYGIPLSYWLPREDTDKTNPRFNSNDLNVFRDLYSMFLYSGYEVRSAIEKYIAREKIHESISIIFEEHMTVNAKYLHLVS
ncbi:MAG: hypothetical protein FWF81_11510 [Defluviitaleaceae bacterium]|nr:hypothetical protein [Defluviitaleaceae bacterium]